MLQIKSHAKTISFKKYTINKLKNLIAKSPAISLTNKIWKITSPTLLNSNKS